MKEPDSPSRAPLVTVVIPVLNEARSLAEHRDRLRQALGDDAEIIFVDDGSTDDSAEVLRELVARDPGLTAVRLRRNFGKSVALATGFRRARGQTIVIMDGDLQESPEEIPRLIDKLEEGYDLVGGWRRVRRDGAAKVWASWVFNWCVSLLGGLRVRDINCGFKVMRREVIEDLTLSVGFHRFIPLLAHGRGFRTVELEVEHRPREHGRSRYRSDRVLSGLLDLIVILFLAKHEGRPGRYFVGFGSLLGIAGFAISLQLAVLWLQTGSIQSKFPRLALGLVLMVVGAQLFAMGLFGELLAYHFRTRGNSFDPVATEEMGADVRAARGELSG